MAPKNNDLMWQRLWERLDRLDARLDRQDEKQDSFAHLQVQHTVILDEHHKRSNNLEKRVEQVASEIKPMLLREALMAKVAKWVGGFGALLGMLWVCLQIGRFFKWW